MSSITINFEKPQEWQINDQPMSDFSTKFVYIPPGLPPNHIARELYDDRVMSVKNTGGSVWISIHPTDCPSSQIANAIFCLSNGCVYCEFVGVDKPYRRKRIATFFYDKVGKIFSAKVVPSHLRTEEAERFWENRLA